METLPLFIGNGFKNSIGEAIPVTNPATQDVLCEVPFATKSEIDLAVSTAKDVFFAWREVPIPERARLMFAYQATLKKEQNEIAKILSRETGKTYADAQGEVWRGIEVVEHACNISSLMMGETVENVARRMDTHSITQPIGVCAGITPFNFPAMIPLWLFPLAIACGNSFILKPSESDPMTPNRLVELFYDSGAPEGVLQLIHGGKEQVDAILNHPDIRAISFVGSVPVAKHVYREGTKNLKRVQALAGAKNHLVVMPDADKDQVISSLVGASCGAAGQRCMAISAAILVGDAAEWLPDLQQAMSAVTPGVWEDVQAGYGPQITVSAKDRILKFIEQGKK
ncbi:MAG TPA: methylmalonate-semialdehyde dehydrogenase (CoA acylating), partial [Gammaproteobacteria bacterium]|nr:methylmalonate-semialdehyde dehydrogenase (CoA acylating) [Gammaproteobacteria bacterium]